MERKIITYCRFYWLVQIVNASKYYLLLIRSTPPLNLQPHTCKWTVSTPHFCRNLAIEFYKSFSCPLSTKFPHFLNSCLTRQCRRLWTPSLGFKMRSFRPTDTCRSCNISTYCHTHPYFYIEARNLWSRFLQTCRIFSRWFDWW